MPRIIKYGSLEYEIPDYEEKYRYGYQEYYVDGIPIDPLLRPFFTVTPHNARDSLEVIDWEDKPYIVTETWEERQIGYSDYLEKYSRLDNFEFKPKQEFIKEQDQFKTDWFKENPSGIRFDVYCLRLDNDSSGDRPICIGWGGTIELALQIAKTPLKPLIDEE